MLSDRVDSLGMQLNNSAGLLSDRVDSLKEDMSNKVDSLERKMYKSEGLLINRVNSLGTRKLDSSAAGLRAFIPLARKDNQDRKRRKNE